MRERERGRESERARERVSERRMKVWTQSSKEMGKENIFVTYLPIRWVQTNKMEKVKVIRRDEWISLDIYSQFRYSKSPARLITVAQVQPTPPAHVPPANNSSHIYYIGRRQTFNVCIWRVFPFMFCFKSCSCLSESPPGHLKGYSCVRLPF